MKIVAITQKGIDKSENEDCIVVGRSILTEGTIYTEIKNGIIAIADGVGGNNAGAMASRFVANKVCDLTDNITLEILEKINSELLVFSMEKSEYRGMATTLSGVLLSEGTNYLFSIGNTRVYSLQSGKYLKQLTIDDTTLNYLLTTGLLTTEEALNFDRRNEITACFGGGTSNLFRIKLTKVDSFNTPIMITSDGIHDYLTVDQMEDIISKFGVSEKSCEEMISVARSAGSYDDISIVLGFEMDK